MNIMNIVSHGWEAAGRILIMSIFCYIFLIIALRISGKRTLSKMNAFDFLVTVALGSTLASSITSKDVGLLEAFLAFSMLILLQFIISKLSVKFEWFDDLVKSEHTILFYKGEFIWDAMKKERVTKKEIQAAIRESGSFNPESIEAVILESSGKFSVINTSQTKIGKKTL